MSLAAFQAALCAMTLDAGLAAQVRREGEPALGHWQLTALEQRRLVAVARQAGMALNCTLARANRFAAVHDAFAMSCVLLGPALRPVLDALWSSQQPRNYQLSGDVERFAATVTAQVLAADAPDGLLGEPQRAYLRDVLAYEAQAYALALGVRHVPDPEHANSPATWVDFAHDPQPLFEALQRFVQPPANLPLARHRVRLALRDGELETTIFGVQDGPAPAAASR